MTTTAAFLVSLLLAAPGGAPADAVRARYHAVHAGKMAPLLTEALRFPTVKGNVAAREAQQAWLRRVAGELGLLVRDAGLVTEVELPGPAGAPVLGLVVHGDVQPVNEADWSVPPFAGVEKGGVIWGRGAADDKGPMVQALLALAALKEAGPARTHTLRLLVGSDEESDNLDIASYLKEHKAPELSLVLDSAFPVVVGEKAWNALTVEVADPYRVRAAGTAPWVLVELKAGLAPSIVPNRAVATLEWHGQGSVNVVRAAEAFRRAPADGLSIDASVQGGVLVLTANGRAAHSGVNIEGGRNALVFLARALDGKLQASGAADLLAFAAQSGQDLHGSGLGITDVDPLWGHYDVNVATIKPVDGGGLALMTNLRRIPPRKGSELQVFLEKRVADWNAAHGSQLVPKGSFWGDEPLVFDPGSKLVKRLLGAYRRATGVGEGPAISGGGTYAKRLPDAIAFGMWFPGKPYPGHDTDERIELFDLHRGVDVLVEALVDLGCGTPLVEPFKP